MKLDAIDLRILAAVRQDGRITKLKLAEIAGLSPTPCWLRLRKLEQAGIIAGYHTRMRAMSFTGSTGVGRLIATQCAPTMKRLVLEPGGHAPLIVFADADIDCGVQITLDAKFATSGQDCLAANRIHVERAILPAFTEKRAARIAALKVGPGLDSTTEVGPLMHARALVKVAAQVEDARQHGGKVMVGGHVHADMPHADMPLAYMPTLITGASDAALIHREETFGPVASVMPFDSEAEVITRANATDCGLVASVVTRDGVRALRLSRALDFGMIAVNRAKITGGPIPFGGWKQSGFGREGSRHGMEAFTELKYLCIDTAA